ncbi:NAD-glutamate dehydrogenase [Alteraurantiacibacter aestuarii]|uniref:Glutamate dehydrogenase n=1 Tax=Alteraurantiacibacter aestuarii TaxID=650004 RepID=A0A844ZJ22_9SPHN|nr:NAD-glutamate dehydrogenase domain-containing protein [Alteraurantiacibacter aestuarii]MXO88471.1 glutamate dehydrogenase [Alteraurantiacibacter aestuarii]
MAKAKAPVSTAKSGTGEQAGQDVLLQTLRDRIARSILPGELPLDGPALDDAARFLLEAAQHRGDGKPSILIRSASGEKRFTRIAIVNRDVPFLVDSIAHAIAARGLTIDRLVHPILPVRRDANRNLAELPQGNGTGEKHESFVYIECDRIDAKERRAVQADLDSAIADVRATVADWPRMREIIASDADRLSDAEGAALLRWLGGGMMTQLGHLVRRRDGATSGHLGICRKSAHELLADSTYERAFAWFDGVKGTPGRSPLIIKANRLSLVHRRVPLDLFIVPLFEDGRVAALSVHAGIWTSAALTSPPETVPVMRQQLKSIMDRLNFTPGGHDHKALIHALSVLPHDLIISFAEDDTLRIATTLMALIDRPRPRVAIVAAPLERHVFAFVWLPRDMLSTTVRLQIQGLLEETTHTHTLDWSLMVEGGNLALLRFVLDARGANFEPDEAAIDARLQDMLRGWGDAVESALGETEEPSRAAALALRYAASFPIPYRAAYGAIEAARDIERLRHMAGEDAQKPLGRDARLYRLESDAADQLRLKIYQTSGSLPLSDAVPALENFGFRVLSEIPTKLGGNDHGTIHDFLLGMPTGEQSAPLLERAEAIEQAITSVLNERAEDDVFNRLVISTTLSAQEAEWLRAFYRYLRQANTAFTIYTVVNALTRAPDVTRALIQLFRTSHDPSFKGDRVQACEAAEDAIRTGLVDVGAINDDRILRLYWQIVRAVLRTNVFAPAAIEALAFKIDSSQVPGLPKPVPWREIFVYSRRVEGIHLRAGPVARGGIRWSDRRDDFRTEILGLMKAQRVKNAVIVPTGAKGGFYPKRLPNPALDRDAWFEEGRESYKLFIRTLLSVTDNIVDDKVIHPQDVVIHDGEDPYFVVAADKGTASFSDTANAIALERGFWLGDAFASGGSNGYDHKVMGITARGAWISVQRHFLEMGVDVQTEATRVVGCGDMSGDVFGNGMLLSRAIKLVAAFDHRHIFIDPDPDPAVSWKERQRLFDMPRSSWAEYDAKLLSKGGGVFARSMKRIPLSKQARALLDVTEEALDPESLISAILKSHADLIWFGGIGTYIKAENETNAEVGDPANDGLRVSARDVRAKAIGEGANLGVTQAGRIEFALRGGRINTDFIDNSAGVDCSDNEVNIKIALTAARKAGRLSEERRNALLQEMTTQVGELVLEDNRLQALALSIAQQGGAQAMGAHLRLIETLEEIGDLDRRTEGLAESDVLARRASDGFGLTRPELAILLSNAKLVLQDAVEGCALADDAAAQPLLMGDFPEQLQQAFPKAILSHRLRKEIVGTVVANQIVNRMGMIYPFELAEEEGVGLSQVACAFVAACDLIGMDAIWRALDEAAMPEAARLALFDQAALGLRGHMADLLRAGGCQIPPSQLKAEIGTMVADLSAHADDALGVEARSHVTAISAQLIEAGSPVKLAHMVAELFAQDGVIGLARLASDCRMDPVELANAFVDLGSRLGLDWAQTRASVMNPSDPWERLLVAGLARDFQQMRFDFLRSQAQSRKGRDDIGSSIDKWAGANSGAIEQFRRIVTRAQASVPVSSAILAQIGSQARNLLQRSS